MTEDLKRRLINGGIISLILLMLSSLLWVMADRVMENRKILDSELSVAIESTDYITSQGRVPSTATPPDRTQDDLPDTTTEVTLTETGSAKESQLTSEPETESTAIISEGTTSAAETESETTQSEEVTESSVDETEETTQETQITTSTTTAQTTLATAVWQPSPNRSKVRVIAMTDGEGDDQASMIRFLLYANEMDIEAIIQTNSIYQTSGHSSTNGDMWLEEHLEAYGQVVGNLRVHDSRYPSKDFLMGRLYLGDEDPSHLVDGSKGIPPFDSTPGSERIIEVLLDGDSRSVWIQAWGGLNTVAQAFYELKYSGDYTEADYVKAANKAKIHAIAFQDNGGKYISEHFPEVILIRSEAFSHTWGYHNDQGEWLGTAWVANHIKGHSAYGDAYPKRSILEGDSPSFMNMINNGLRAHVYPSYGGWGGRFVKSGDYFEDAYDNGSIYNAMSQYIDEAQNDFAARIDWTANGSYGGANHPPVAYISQGYTVYASPGEQVVLDGSASYDPDGNAVTLKWRRIDEADSMRGDPDIQLLDGGKGVSLTIPEGEGTGKKLHMLLEVKDNGKPQLTNYYLTIIRVK